MFQGGKLTFLCVTIKCIFQCHKECFLPNGTALFSKRFSGVFVNKMNGCRTLSMQAQLLLIEYSIQRFQLLVSVVIRVNRFSFEHNCAFSKLLEDFACQWFQGRDPMSIDAKTIVVNCRRIVDTLTLETCNMMHTSRDCDRSRQTLSKLYCIDFDTSVITNSYFESLL